MTERAELPFLTLSYSDQAVAVAVATGAGTGAIAMVPRVPRVAMANPKSGSQSTRRKPTSKSGKTAKPPEPRLSRTRRPPELAVANWQAALRRQFGRGLECHAVPGGLPYRQQDAMDAILAGE